MTYFFVTIAPIGLCSSSQFQDGGKASFTLCLHPGLTKLPALASLDQEGSLPDHAPLCSRLSEPQDAISVRLLQNGLFGLLTQSSTLSLHFFEIAVRPFCHVSPFPHFLSAPTTPQSVFPVADQRVDERRVCCLRRSCGGNRRTPLLGESERVLPQSGHSAKVTELSVHRLRSMGITVLENVHLGDVLVCPCSCTVSAVFVVFCCSLSWPVSRSSSVPLARADAASSGRAVGASGPAPSIIRSVSRRSTSS